MKTGQSRANDRPSREEVDPIILAGIFHKQFVIIHPFVDGNGRTARLATKVLLAATGFNTSDRFSFENYYNRNVTKYFQMVGVFGHYYEIRDSVDFTEWLAPTLQPYHRKLLGYIEKHGFITDREYAKLTERAKATRSLDFRKLIEMGVIEKLGKGKATYYRAL